MKASDNNINYSLKAQNTQSQINLSSNDPPSPMTLPKEENKKDLGTRKNGDNSTEICNDISDEDKRNDCEGDRKSEGNIEVTDIDKYIEDSNNEDRKDQELKEDITFDTSILSHSSQSLSSLEDIGIPATPPREDAVKLYRKRRTRLRVCVLIQLLIDILSIIIPFVPVITNPHTYHHVPLIISPLMAQIYLHKPCRKIFIAALINYLISGIYCTALCVFGLISFGFDIGIGKGNINELIPYIVSALSILVLDGVGVILTCGIRLHCIPSEAENYISKNINCQNHKNFLCYRARPLEDILRSYPNDNSITKPIEFFEKIQKRAKNADAPVVINDCVAELTSSFDISQAIPSPTTDQMRELELLVTKAAKTSTEAFLNAPSLDSSAAFTSNTVSRSMEPIKIDDLDPQRRIIDCEVEARRHQPLRKGVLYNDEDENEYCDENIRGVSGYENQLDKRVGTTIPCEELIRTPMQPGREYQGP